MIEDPCNLAYITGDQIAFDAANQPSDDPFAIGQLPP